MLLKSLGTARHSVESLGLVVVTWTRNGSFTPAVNVIVPLVRSTGLSAYNNNQFLPTVHMSEHSVIECRICGFVLSFVYHTFV